MPFDITQAGIADSSLPDYLIKHRERSLFRARGGKPVSISWTHPQIAAQRFIAEDFARAQLFLGPPRVYPLFWFDAGARGK
jgi:hypothetical protein